MNYKKPILFIILFGSLNLFGNAQGLHLQGSTKENSIALSTIHDSSETHLKSILGVYDKIYGNNTEVPEFEPEIIDDSDELKLYWLVYPNPTYNNIVLWVKNLDSLQTKVNMSYHLYDAKGNILLDDKVEGERTVISIEFLSPSLYYLSVLTDKSIKSFKIIKY
jgi:hypothetical protein